MTRRATAPTKREGGSNRPPGRKIFQREEVLEEGGAISPCKKGCERLKTGGREERPEAPFALKRRKKEKRKESRDWGGTRVGGKKKKKNPSEGKREGG